MNLTILIGFLGGMGGTEIFLIILVLLLFFGGKRIPELAKGLGKGIREFKDAKDNVKKEIEDNINADQSTVVKTSSNAAPPVKRENTPI